MRGRMLAAGAAALTAGMLTGCAVDAGRATGDGFAEYMRDVPGVVATDDQMMNTLPFIGDGSLIITLDSAADDQVLKDAVEHALAYPPLANVTIDSLMVDVTPDGEADRADFTGLDRKSGERGVALDMPWASDGSASDDLIDRARAIAALPAVVRYVHFDDDGTDDVSRFLIVDDQLQGCAAARAVDSLDAAKDGTVAEPRIRNADDSRTIAC